MATIDLTRTIFEPRKRYAGVRMQQGRVVLDDDHNEAQDLGAEDARRMLLDVVGPSGTPDDGFKVENPTLTGGNLVDFTVRAGTMYVGGVPVRLDHDTTFAAQPDWVGIAAADRTRSANATRDMVYLEVWQQPVSAEEDRELAEPALGGPDTTTRLRTMARVRRRSVTSAKCAAAWAEITNALQTSGIGTWNEDTCELQTDVRLKVTYPVGGVGEDLCSPSVTAGYLGAENQAIRVQLVQRLGAVGSGELTWGYNNASPLYRARVVNGTTLELETPPRDEASWPLKDQVVEVLPWSAVLVPDGDPTRLHGEVLADGGGRAMPSTAGQAVSLGGGHLSQLASSYSATDHRIRLATPLPPGFNTRAAPHVAAGVDTDRHGEGRGTLVFVRVWNRGSDNGSSARLPYIKDQPLTLGKSGIQVTITGTQLGADAHWIIGARPNTPDQVYPWSFEDDGGRAPNGVRRFLVPLAVVTWSGATGTVHDCRRTFRPLTALDSCCVSIVVTPRPGWEAQLEQIRDGQDADICFQPGDYPLTQTLVLRRKGHLRITGAGLGTSLAGGTLETLIQFEDCKSVAVRDLAAHAKAVHRRHDQKPHLNGVLTFQRCGAVVVERVRLRCASAALLGATCLTVNNEPVPEAGPLPEVRIRDSEFFVGEGQTGILLVNVGRADVEGNTVVAAPAVEGRMQVWLKDKQFLATNRLVLSQGVLLQPEGQPSEPHVDFRVKDTLVRLWADKRLVKGWEAAIKAVPFAGEEVTVRAVKQYIGDIAKSLLYEGKAELEGKYIAEFGRWLREVAEEPAAAFQGVVVAGTVAEEVRISNNTIRGVMQGIHVGLSHSDPSMKEMDQANRVIVSGNTIHVTVPSLSLRGRHGIFVGNCNSLTIKDNFATFKRLGDLVSRYAEGICVYGYLGRLALVKDNHLVDFPIGIRVRAINGLRDGASSLWRVTENVAERASLLIAVWPNHVITASNVA